MAKTTKQRDPQPRRSAVSHAVRTHIQSRRNQYLAAAVVSGALAMPQQAPAQDLIIEEIMVTAQKREQNLQDVPVAVTAFNNTALTELGIQGFADFAAMVPSLNYKSFGYPGGATLYMRGAADGGDGNPSGSAPSVAVYLDEQPVSSIGSNLDIHIYDMERIEALVGPQGTLYGASSQTGTVRYITNKPDPAAFEGGIDVQGYGMTDGDTSYSVEGFVNFPISDNAAIRLVGWYLDEGGWIDNVATDANTVAGPNQQVAGVYTYSLPGARTFTLTNDALVKEDQNELTKIGARAALGIDLNENWTATASVFYQDMESEGVWEHAPSLVGERNVQRYSPDRYDDEWTQFGLTVEGEFADHRLVYAGAFMDRDAFYEGGYHAYGDYNGYSLYWACDYTGTAATDCTSREEFATSPYAWERTSHELRLLSMGDSRLHYTVGAFYEKIEFTYQLNFFQQGMSEAVWVTGIPDLYFRTWQTREDSQFALFGEVTFDLTDSVSVTGGVRYFDEEGTVQGVVGWDNTVFDPPGTWDTFIDSKVSNDDAIFKANVTWTVTDDVMLYATWSEGYRAGGINRDPGLPPSALTWIPDIMTNYEIGWKTTLANGRVRLNGAAYLMEWDDVQYTIYNFGLSACCGNVYNLATAEITGLEFDLTALISEAFTLSLAGAYNDAETTADFNLPTAGGTTLAVPDGSPLPSVPDFKGTVVARYEFDLTSSLPAYAQLSWSYTGSSESEITPGSSFPQDSYSIGNLRAGINQGSWGVDLFVDNVSDEVADIYIHPRTYELTTVTNRPRTYGVRYWTRFK